MRYQVYGYDGIEEWSRKFKTYRLAKKYYQKLQAWDCTPLFYYKGKESNLK